MVEKDGRLGLTHCIPGSPTSSVISEEEDPMPSAVRQRRLPLIGNVSGNRFGASQSVPYSGYANHGQYSKILCSRLGLQVVRVQKVCQFSTVI